MTGPTQRSLRVPMLAKSIVNVQAAREFSRVWSFKGALFVNLDDAHLQFATDFANAVVTSLLEQQQKSEQKKIILTE